MARLHLTGAKPSRSSRCGKLLTVSLSLTLVLSFAKADKAHAAQPAAQSTAAAAPLLEVPDVPDGRRSYAQSALGKIRAGYNLGGPEQMPPPADTRGEWGLRRDTLVGQHYRHMAELDTLAGAAVRNHDIATAERAEAVRRRDIQRFMRQLQALRRELLKQQADAGP